MKLDEIKDHISFKKHKCVVKSVLNKQLALKQIKRAAFCTYWQNLTWSKKRFGFHKTGIMHFYCPHNWQNFTLLCHLCRSSASTRSGRVDTNRNVINSSQSIFKVHGTTKI